MKQYMTKMNLIDSFMIGAKIHVEAPASCNLEVISDIEAK